MKRAFAGMLMLGLAGLPGWAEGKFSNRRAPGFSLPDSQGNQHDPQDHRGKVILLDFMQTSCPNCKVVSGILEQVKAKAGAQAVVLSVVVLPDTVQNVQRYIAENGIKAPILFDSGQMTASYLKITPQNPSVHFPHLFVIDPEGMIRNDFDYHDLDHGKMTAARLVAEIHKWLPGAAPKKR